MIGSPRPCRLEKIRVAFRTRVPIGEERLIVRPFGFVRKHREDFRQSVQIGVVRQTQSHQPRWRRFDEGGCRLGRWLRRRDEEKGKPADKKQGDQPTGLGDGELAWPRCVHDCMYRTSAATAIAWLSLCESVRWMWVAPTCSSRACALASSRIKGWWRSPW